MKVLLKRFHSQLKNFKTTLYSIIISTTVKYCSVAFIWMVTPKDFIHRHYNGLSLICRFDVKCHVLLNYVALSKNYKTAGDSKKLRLFYESIIIIICFSDSPSPSPISSPRKSTSDSSQSSDYLRMAKKGGGHKGVNTFLLCAVLYIWASSIGLSGPGISLTWSSGFGI